MKYLDDDIKFFSRVVSGSESGVVASAEQIMDYAWNGNTGAFQTYINTYLKSEIDTLKTTTFDFEPITEQEIRKDL